MVLKKPERNCRLFSIKTSGCIEIPADYTVSLDKSPWVPRLGDIITLQDEFGYNYRGRICHVYKTRFRVHIFEFLKKCMESPLPILLLQALPEKERMEWIIQKATELGVNSVVPFCSRRSVKLEEREKKQPKAHRWPIIARKAAQQCRRATVPVIKPYTDFYEALLQAEGYDLKLILWEGEHDSGLSTESFKKIVPCRICILVGPEGGFAQEEVDAAKEQGFMPISLGPRILRTETAAIAIIAVIQYIWGDLG